MCFEQCHYAIAVIGRLVTIDQQLTCLTPIAVSGREIAWKKEVFFSPEVTLYVTDNRKIFGS
jgi:hypothetical protein